jgi:hypothetical protein
MLVHLIKNDFAKFKTSCGLECFPRIVAVIILTGIHMVL